MPAAVQKETFESLLGETLAEDCSYHVVQAVHSQLRDMIEEHKASKEEQPLLLSKGRCGPSCPPAAWPPPMWMPLRPSMTRPSARRPA